MLFTSWFQKDKKFNDFSQFKPSIELVKGGISIFSPAKINLYLKIGEKLKNGYHNIETIYAGTSLIDSIFISTIKKRAIELSSNVKEIVNGENTIVKIIQLLAKKHDIKNRGFKVILNKNIPIGGGLGGENSNAVFTYFAMHKLLSIPIRLSEATKDLKQFGADNLFFLYGGICYGIGLPDKILVYNPQVCGQIANCDLEKCYVLLIYPLIKTDTHQMYELFDKFKTQDLTSKLAYKIQNPFIHNDFKNILCEKYKKIKIIFNKIEELGLKDMSGVSGSGSTVFIILKSNKEVMNIWHKLSSTIKNISGACTKFVKNWRNILYN